MRGLHKAPRCFAHAMRALQSPLGSCTQNIHTYAIFYPTDMMGCFKSLYTEGALHIQRGLCEVPKDFAHIEGAV